MATAHTTKEAAAQLGLELELMLLEPNNLNIPDDRLNGGEFSTITVHDTANTSVGANALMHWLFVKNGGGKEGVSFTFTVDDRHAIEILAEDNAQYAQGTGTGNYTSISIEMCINSDGNKVVTRDNLAKLLAALCFIHHKPRTVIVQHNVWYGKDCPGSIRHEAGAWQKLLDDVEHYIGVLVSMNTTQTPPPKPTEPIVVNGFTIKQGFLGLWNKYGIEVMGLPCSPEYITPTPIPGRGVIPVTFQDFENVMVQWYPGIDARICAGVRMLKYGH